MKAYYKSVALAKLCRLLGITPQAYYKHFKRQTKQQTITQLILKQITRIRSNHPHMGGRKLYKLIGPFLEEHQIKMGRDALFDLLSINHLLVKRKRRKAITTNSLHPYRKYPNLIKGYLPKTINRLWVSDITYWRIDSGFVYISLITDAYSRKIVGYHVSDNASTGEVIQALKMALKEAKDNTSNLFHHSDRGIQYCSHEYTNLLKSHHIQISMTQNGDPYENAMAERVNGIIKEEYLNDYRVATLAKAKKILALVIKLYNEERPHMSCAYQVPQSVHSQMMLKYG